MCCVATSSAQSLTISGTVIDQTLNDPLPGVSVFVKGSSNGTSSDFDGNFNITNVEIGSILVFSYIGFVTKEIVIENDNVLNISLLEDVSALDEVVVIGYGTATKKEITGAVSVIGSETIEDLNPVNIENALQGQVAGVQITSASGSPGANANIRIRGISTNGDSRPLILVDGNVIEDLSVINPNDIESINILKDATAGIYGVRAANGVILVTTKTGKKGSPLRFSYDFYGGYQETTREIPVLNSTEYAVIVNEAFTSNGQAAPFPDISRLGTGTDWQEEVFQKAPVINHNISATWGTEKSTYSVGASLLTQNGIVGGPKTNFRRFTTRINYNRDLTEKLKLTANALYTGTNRKTLNENGIGSVLFNAINNSPTFDVRDSNGNFTLTPGFPIEVINPIAQIAITNNQNLVDRISGKIGLRYSFLDNFTAESSVQGNYAEVRNRTFNPSVNFGPGNVFNNIDPRGNRLAVNKDIFKDYTFDIFINYDQTFAEDHNVKATLGNSVFVTQGQFSGVSAGFFSDPIAFSDAEIFNAAEVRNEQSLAGDSGKFDDRLLSYFFRGQYSYKGKYLFSGVIRRDGSTKFGPENRFGYFPSASIGWVASDESFLENNNTVNFLKFRGSYGVLGNDRIESNGFRGVLDGEAAYVFNGAVLFGQAVGILPNPAIQWEEQKTLDIGLDLKLFNSRVDITADYFRKVTEGLLLQPQVSNILGPSAPGSQPPFVNGGEIENKGFEFAIGYTSDRSKDFNYSVNYNATFLENETLEVNNEAGFIAAGSFGVGQDPPSRLEAGFPVGYFYGLQTDGLFQNQTEVDAHATQQNAAPGDLRFVDTNQDGQIDENDRTDIGNPIPDVTMGFNLAINYKNWDFGSYIFASLGNEIVRDYERNQPLVNRSVFTLNRWRGEGTSNTIPRVTTGATQNTNFSDFFVEDGSFARIQNAQIGYTLPQEVVENMGISKLRIYLSANNIYTFTEYKGYDPSATSGDAIGGGIDRGFYPVPRTYLLGLNLKF